MAGLIQNGRLLWRFIRGSLSDQITVERMNAIIDSVNQNRITSVVGGSFRRSTEGTTIVVQPSNGGGGTVTTQEIWDLSVSENDPVDTNYRLDVVPGTFGGVIATNYATGLQIPKTGTRYICFDVTTIDGATSTMAYSVETVLPDPPVPTADAPQTSFKFLFGVTVDGVPTKLCGAGIFNAIPIESYRVAKIAPSAGELPYTVYYNWLVRQ